MDLYQSHKIVRAAKIVSAEKQKDGRWHFMQRSADGTAVPNTTTVEEASRFRITEEDLGYVVEYEGGYTSWSPTKAFEEGYARIDPGRIDGGNEERFLSAPGSATTERQPVDVIGDAELEAKLAASPAPRVTPADIEEAIAGVSFLEWGGTTLTICVIQLRNGFTVTGESACADPANYNQDIGRKVALDKAKEKIWPLEGYLLRQRLYLRDLVERATEAAGDEPPPALGAHAFRKKPVVIEAKQWTGENTDAVVEWAQGGYQDGGIWLAQRLIDKDSDEAVWRLVIPTLEGDHDAAPGDWIIRGVKGELYPCKPDIFAATYEPA